MPVVKRVFSLILKGLFAILFLLSGTLFSASAVLAEEDSDSRTISATYYSVTNNKPLSVDVPYSDSWFTESASHYNHGLAQASVGFTVSAFRISSSDSPNGYSDGPVIQFMKQAGFSGIRTNDYDRTPGRYTIASAMGHKEIREGDQTFELIAVGISGQGYRDEWLSNLSVGDETYHVGFTDAADDMFDRFFGYIVENHLTAKKLKVWVVGFSRAAAVTNILAARLTDTDWFSSDTVYAYTFGTPRTTKKPNEGRYPNIFSIVGTMDPVTKVPFLDWGYSRYGTTLFTPAQETDSRYMSKKERANKLFKQLTGIEFWNNPEMDNTLRLVMQYLIEIVPSSTIYAKYLEDQVLDIWQDKSAINILRKLFDLSEDKNLINDNNRKKANELLDYMAMTGIFAATGSQEFSLWESRASTGANIIHEHTPDVYLSWMLSTDNPEELFSSNSDYSIFYLDHPAEIIVSSNGKEIMTVHREGTVDVAEENVLFAVRQEPDYVSVTIPDDVPYSVAVRAVDGNPLTVQRLRVSSEHFDQQYHESAVLNLAEGETAQVIEQGEWKAGTAGVMNLKETEADSLSETRISITDLFAWNISWREIVLTMITVVMIAAGFGLFLFTSFFQIVRTSHRIHIGALPKGTKAHLYPPLAFVMVFVLYLLMEFFRMLYPSSIEPITSFKLPIACLLISVVWYAYMKVPTELHLFTYMGITVICCGDIVINYTFAGGMLFHWIGVLLLAYGFWKYEKPSRLQWIGIAAVSIIGSLFIYQSGSQLGSRCVIAIVYYCTLVVLVFFSLQVPKRFMNGSFLLLISGVLEIYYEILLPDTFAYAVMHIILVGTFYLALMIIISGPLKVIDIPLSNPAVLAEEDGAGIEKA